MRGGGSMRTINMLSSADKVKGQGVGSAYLEQVRLVEDNRVRRQHATELV